MKATAFLNVFNKHFIIIDTLWRERKEIFKKEKGSLNMYVCKCVFVYV